MDIVETQVKILTSNPFARKIFSTERSSHVMPYGYLFKEKSPQHLKNLSTEKRKKIYIIYFEKLE